MVAGGGKASEKCRKEQKSAFQVPACAVVLRRPARPLVTRPRLNVALARLVDLKAALLAETSARGPDGSRMRSPQLARTGERPAYKGEKTGPWR
jgi:hypothetical protein